MAKERKIMKKILQSIRTAVLVLAAVVLFSGTGVLTAQAAGTVMFPGMKMTNDGRVETGSVTSSFLAQDSEGREWYDRFMGYPFYNVIETEERVSEWTGETHTVSTYYLGGYLTDFIEAHPESEWPGFVVKGSDGVPFYYSEWTADASNCDVIDGVICNWYYVKYCYDRASGWWLLDKSYKGPYCGGFGSGNVDVVGMDDLIAQTRKDIEDGKTVNGTPVKPVQPDRSGVSITDDEPGKPSGPVNPPTEGEGITDPYADVNTLGAAVKLKTDCIRVKKNNKAQKPLPTSVKVGKKTLKRNKTFTVSYEKYVNGWDAVDAVTDEGIYRLVVTGKNGYEGVYKKRLYVTADRTVKAMSSVSVKVNKMPYTGEPVTSGVIKTAKIGKRKLEEGVDYTVKYENNLDSGTAQVTLTAIEGSGLLGTKTVSFSITGNRMSKVKAKGLGPVTYSPGTDMVQDMSNVALTYGRENTLTEGKDFTVSYANNTKAGTAKIIFTGKGLYNGTLTKTFKITKAPLNEGMLDDASRKIQMEYTKKALKPDVTLKDGGTVLVKGKDYTLAYRNNVKISDKAVITVKAKGSYKGSFNVNFTITDRIEKPDKADETDKTDKTDTTDGPDKTDKTDTTDETDRTDETDTTDEPGKTDETDNTDEPGRTDETDNTDESGKTDETDTTDESGRTDETDTTDESGKTDETDTTDESGRTDETDTTDESGKTDETDTTDESDRTDETDTTDESGKTDETDNTDESGKTDETDTTDGSDRADETGETKLTGVRTCWCGYTVDITDNGNMTAAEEAAWKEHAGYHTSNGESTNYTDKFSDGTETEGSETEGTETEGSETGGSETEGSETETMHDKPIGFYICNCGHVEPCYEYGSALDEAFVNHLAEHSAKGESTRYTSISYEKAIKYGYVTE